MIPRIAALIPAALLCLACAGPASADGLFVQTHGGVSLFNMDDVNAAIDTWNDGPAGGSLDHINHGWDLGLRAGYFVTPELGLGLGYARLSGSSGFSRDGYLAEFDMPADLYEIFLDFVPVHDRAVNVGAGATVGMIVSQATVKTAVPGTDELTEAFDGTGFLFAGYGILDVRLSPKFSLFGHGGFRHAVINKLSLDGETVLNPDSLDDQLRFSYSGFFMRVGIRFRS